MSNKKIIAMILGTITVVSVVALYDLTNSNHTSGYCTYTITLPHPGLIEAGRTYKNGTITLWYYENPAESYSMVPIKTVIEGPCGFDITYEIITISNS